MNVNNLQEEGFGHIALPWNDFYLILTIARHGNIGKASVAMKMTHATTLRRLYAVESRLKARLFDRQRGRYSLTPAGEKIAQAAAKFEGLARDAALHVTGLDLKPSGDVRLAVSSVVVDHLLPAILADFNKDYPEVTIELVVSRDPISLSRREADIAIRIVDKVPEWLVGRKLMDVQFCIYGRRADSDNNASLLDLFGKRKWICFEKDVRDFKFDRWLQAHIPDDKVTLRVDNFSHAALMVQSGLGIALLPTFTEKMYPDLVPLAEPIGALDTPMWMITHQELRNVARVKVAMQSIGSGLVRAYRAK